MVGTSPVVPRGKLRSVSKVWVFEQTFETYIDCDKVNDELGNLETSNPLFPGNANSTCTLEIVPVHDNVNEQIQSDRNPRYWSVSDKLGIAQESCCWVVVAMKESLRSS